MKTTKHWFGVDPGTEVVVTGEANSSMPPPFPATRIIIVKSADGSPLVGPNGPQTEVGMDASYLSEPVPPQARNIDLLDLNDLK